MIVEIEKDVGQWQRTIVEAEALKRLLSVSQYVDVPWFISESANKAEEENHPAPHASCSDLRRPMDMFAATYEKFLKSLMEIKAIKEAQKFGTTSGKAPSSGLFQHLLSSPLLLSCTSGQSTWASDRQPSQASGQLLPSPHSVAAAGTNNSSTQQQMAVQTVRPSKLTATAGINRVLPASTCRKHLYSLQRRDLTSLKAVLNRTSFGSSARKNTGKTWLKQPPPLLLAGFSSAADNYRARSKSRSSGAMTSVSAEGAKHLKRRNGSGALTSSSAASGSLKLKKQRKAAAAAAGGLLSNIHMTTAVQEPLLGMAGSFHQKDSSMVPGQHRLILKHSNFLLTEASEIIRDPAAHHLPTTQKQDHEQVQQDNADSKSSRYLHSFALNETLVHPEVPEGEYSQATLSAASHSSLLFHSQPQHLPVSSSIIPSRNSSHLGSYNPMHPQPLGDSFPYQTHGIMPMWPYMSIPDLNAAYVPLCFNQASMANPYPFSMDMAFGGSGMVSSYGMHPFPPQPLHFNPMVAASAAVFHDLSYATSAFGHGSTGRLNGASNTTTLNPAELETMMASGMPPITPTTPATTPQMLLSKLALQAPYWVVMLDYVAGAAGSNTMQSKGLTNEAERMKAYRLPMTKSAVARYYGQTVHSSAELVALMRGGQLQEQTLIAGVSGPTVPRLPLPSVHMRPMQMLLAMVKTGMPYPPLTLLAVQSGAGDLYSNLPPHQELSAASEYPPARSNQTMMSAATSSTPTAAVTSASSPPSTPLAGSSSRAALLEYDVAALPCPLSWCCPRALFPSPGHLRNAWPLGTRMMKGSVPVPVLSSDDVHAANTCQKKKGSKQKKKGPIKHILAFPAASEETCRKLVMRMMKWMHAWRPTQTRKELSVAAQYAADSCLNLLASTGPKVQWTCVMSYDRWGGWRTAGQRLSAERMLDMLLEGHIDEYTPVVCTEADLPFGTWLPTALLLPLGALVHMQDGVGARYQALSLKQSRLISEDEGLAVQTPLFDECRNVQSII